MGNIQIQNTIGISYMLKSFKDQDSYNYVIENKHDKNIKNIDYRTNNVYIKNLDKTSNHG